MKHASISHYPRAPLKWVTAKDLADVLGVSINWVWGQTRKRNKNSSLPAGKFGKYVRFPLLEAINWYDGQVKKCKAVPYTE